MWLLFQIFRGCTKNEIDNLVVEKMFSSLKQYYQSVDDSEGLGGRGGCRFHSLHKADTKAAGVILRPPIGNCKMSHHVNDASWRQMLIWCALMSLIPSITPASIWDSAAAFNGKGDESWYVTAYSFNNLNDFATNKLQQYLPIAS